VDLDKDGNPLKWKIENSWGDEVGKKGFFLMDDEWFSEYVYEVDVDKKYLTEEEKENYGKKPAMLPFYDPMCCTLD
ncbi:MAG: C1 family peptidase, partial [Bacilli bacterium]